MSSAMNEARILFCGFIFCHEGCDFENCLVGCVNTQEYLCLRSNHCCALHQPNRGVGMITEPEKGECCKVGLYCCDYALITPNKLCAHAGQSCCFYRAASFPFDKEYLGKPVYGKVFCQCTPDLGMCQPPPEIPALDQWHLLKNGGARPVQSMTMMDREEEDFNHGLKKPYSDEYEMS